MGSFLDQDHAHTPFLHCITQRDGLFLGFGFVVVLGWGFMLLRLKQLDVRRNDCEISDRVFVRRAFERNTPSSQSRSRISAFLSGLTFLPFRKAVAILAAFKGLW